MIGGNSRARFIGAVLIMAVLAACGDKSYVDRTQSLDAYTPEQIYERGEFELERSRNDDAAWFFSEVERLYPYSDWAKRALIMQAYSYHEGKDYPNSRSAAQRYIDFYPTDEDAAYAQYLLALSYYDQIDEVGRDQGLTFQALQALRTVIEVYPESEYATTAILKFDLAFNHLAGKEMEIGRYYLRHKHFTAAINRFRVVVEDFQTTSHTAEALFRLIEAYLSLGLFDQAETAGAILGYNYRSSEWYEDAYKLLTSNDLKMRDPGNNWLSNIYRQSVKGQWL